MARNRNQEQFEEYRDWQWCKHVLLRDYVKPWSVIVGKAAQEIYAVDTCAGAGSYQDPLSGESQPEGSPVIFARRAAAYTAERGPGKSMRLICCEQDRGNYTSLVDALKPFETHVTALYGSYHGHVPWIVETLGTSPALIFLDPIGLKTIKADAWAPLLERRGKTDLFIVLHFAVVHRIGGMLLPDGTADSKKRTAKGNAAMLDTVFRGPEWRAIAIDPALQGERHREERERRYVQLFFDRVIGKRHRWKCAFEVRAKESLPVKYWLVHASDDFKPYMLVNDEVVKLNEMLLRRECEYPEGSLFAQLDAFAEADFESQVSLRRASIQAELTEAVLDCVRNASRNRLPFGAIRDQLVNRFFGRVKQGAYSNTVKQLCKDDRLRRRERLGAALGDLEQISLPEVTPESDGGAEVVSIRPAA